MEWSERHQIFNAKGTVSFKSIYSIFTHMVLKLMHCPISKYVAAVLDKLIGGCGCGRRVHVPIIPLLWLRLWKLFTSTSFYAIWTHSLMDAEQYFLIIHLTRVLAHNDTACPLVIARTIQLCLLLKLLCPRLLKWSWVGCWTGENVEIIK